MNSELRIKNYLNKGGKMPIAKLQTVTQFVIFSVLHLTFIKEITDSKVVFVSKQGEQPKTFDDYHAAEECIKNWLPEGVWMIQKMYCKVDISEIDFGTEKNT